MKVTLNKITLMTTDPVHIGVGGYRLGRVDNAIVREPGTRIPKIPGTSISGAARSYAARRYGKIRCAGQGQKDLKHCGSADCPICYTFGSLVGEQGYAGTVNLFDAQVILFPVHTAKGPMWVSTPGRLAEAGFSLAAGDAPGEAQALLSMTHTGSLNFGWLVLDTGSAPEITPPAWNPASDLWATVKGRLALVNEKLFAAIVNSNLEVRTSVSINPKTGAAESGALFTYEALPRFTWLSMDIVEDNFRNGEPWAHGAINETSDNQPLGDTWSRPLDVAIGGLKLAEMLGIGGMGTRGFGRIKIIGNFSPA